MVQGLSFSNRGGQTGPRLNALDRHLLVCSEWSPWRKENERAKRRDERESE